MVAAGLTGCVSRSLPQQRFIQSAALTGPNFTVTLGDPQNFSFAVVGDLHVRGNAQRFKEILQRAADEGDAFVVLLGDLVDQGDAESFQLVEDAIKEKGFQGKVLTILGNHDVFHEGWEEYRNRFGPSHYVVTVGNSRFIALDSADGSLARDSVTWLQEKLNEPKPTHTFLLTHHAPVVPGIRTYLKLVSEELSHRLMKMASVAGVRAWFSGHYHAYVRGEVAGVTYFVAGGGGGRLMAPSPDYFYVQIRVNGNAVTDSVKTLSQ